jgi:hypothetical protein
VSGDYESTYATVLRGGSDIQLLRLLQKSGPCWHALSAQTAAELLAALVRMVRDGTMIARVSGCWWGRRE